MKCGSQGAPRPSSGINFSYIVKRKMDGMKKAWGKTAQSLAEKLGNDQDKTELDPQFKEMERQTDCTAKTVETLLNLTREFLQPNPSNRAHLVSGSSYSKIQHGNRQRIEQTEEKLGKLMRRNGLELSDSNFGQALITVGEGMSQLSDTRNQFDDTVKTEVLDPLQTMLDKDLKEVTHRRKKLTGRRLDYDYKRGKQKTNSKISDDEVNMSYEKLEESIQLAGTAMHNLLTNDVEQVSQLAAFIESQITYHKECNDILEPILVKLNRQRSELEHQPMKTMELMTIKNKPAASDAPFNTNLTAISQPTPTYNSRPTPSVPTRTPSAQPRKPTAQALYDFEPENPGELEFCEGDMITLRSQIDENWFEGEIHGKTGYFPINYVRVVVPLP